MICTRARVAHTHTHTHTHTHKDAAKTRQLITHEKRCDGNKIEQTYQVFIVMYMRSVLGLGLADGTFSCWVRWEA